MADSEQVVHLREGVEAWNAWRRENPKEEINFYAADLSRAHLSGANLIGVNLTLASLIEANLTGAYLTGANLNRSDLRAAKVNGADLRAAKVRGASLDGADLSRANLSGADLTGSDLMGARLTRAIISQTVFGDLDLSGVLDLDTVSHHRPSTIGIDTIFRSGGRIPEVFLRGAGVPDILITHIPSLVGSPLDYYTCFISHSSKDRRFCDRLHADLQAKGVRIWYFYEDARWGEPVWREIDQSIRVYDKLVVVCSQDSLRSGPVLREMERALQREDREGKNVLFPIRIDDYLFEGWEHERKADVIAKVAGDFTGWQRTGVKYARAFDRLLQALQAN